MVGWHIWSIRINHDIEISEQRYIFFRFISQVSLVSERNRSVVDIYRSIERSNETGFNCASDSHCASDRCLFRLALTCPPAASHVPTPRILSHASSIVLILRHTRTNRIDQAVQWIYKIMSNLSIDCPRDTILGAWDTRSVLRHSLSPSDILNLVHGLHLLN